MSRISTQLTSYLTAVDEQYNQSMKSLKLFHAESRKAWSSKEIRQFAAMFYHIRGYFIDFMWYLANFNSNKCFKQIILDNIGEEIGINAPFSHEQLYAQFAAHCGVDIHDEILNRTNYPDFAKIYNQKHIEWLQTHCDIAQIAAFAAYERLDNIDYSYLYQLGRCLNLPSEALTFFKVHTHVEHFGPVFPLLEEHWSTHENEIKSGFEFIYSHQLKMWHHLSASLFQVQTA